MDIKHRPYTLQKYNPEWPVLFEKEKKIIQDIFGESALRIDHVGSTAVPGMWAKPQIDIMVVVENIDSIGQFVEPMNRFGYEFDKDFIPNGKYFYKDSSLGERLVTIQVFQNNNEEIVQKLYFRDYLKSHPEEIDFYSQVKRKAYDNGKSNRVEYSENKKASLLKLLERAKIWHLRRGKNF